MSDRYIILTESSCDLSQELVDQLGIEVLPLTFTMEGKTYPHYPDGREFSLSRFYQKMHQGVSVVTAAANVAELTEAMEIHLKQGVDVLFLCFSSGLSSTRDSCAIAAAELRDRYPQRKIFTVDTLAACGGQGLLVYLAAQRQKAGAAIEEVRDFTEEQKLHLAHWFTVDDLVYLKRGGRLSPTVAAVGTMLNIKPVLHVDDEGHLIALEKVRGRKASIGAMLRHMEKTAIQPEKQTVLISHADCPEDAEHLRTLVEEQFHPRKILITEIGPIVGAHGGPGLLTLFFLAEHR